MLCAWYSVESQELTTFILPSLQKSVAVAGSVCRNPGLNQGPLDLQSNALPTELFRLVVYMRASPVFV